MVADGVQLNKKIKNTYKESEKQGIDVKLIEYNLSLSFAKRLDQHEKARQLLILLQQAPRKSRGKSK